jgi:type I restriction enzyme R subunit
MTINNVDEEVSNKVLKEVRKTLLKINYQEANVIALHQLKYGVKVRDDIQHRDINYKLVDFIKPQNNKFTLIRQLEVLHEDGRKRYPDIVLFLNGIPVVVCEIKKPLAVEDTSDAFDQNQTLFKHSPHLFAYNILNFVSNNIITRYGNIDSPFKYYGG